MEKEIYLLKHHVKTEGELSTSVVEMAAESKEDALLAMAQIVNNYRNGMGVPFFIGDDNCEYTYKELVVSTDQKRRFMYLSDFDDEIHELQVVPITLIMAN